MTPLGQAVLSSVERLSSFRGDIHKYFRLVLCWEVFPVLEYPLSEVSLYVQCQVKSVSHLLLGLMLCRTVMEVRREVMS